MRIPTGYPRGVRSGPITGGHPMEIESGLPCRPDADGIVRFFAEQVNAALSEWQRRLAEDPGSFGQVEGEAMDLVRPFAGLLAVAALEAPPVKEAVAARAEAVRVAALGRPRIVYRRPRWLRLLSGLAIRVSCAYCAPRTRRPERGFQRGVGRRGIEGAGLYPEWAVLGISEGISPELQSTIARWAVMLPSLNAAREELARQGAHLDVKTVRRVALEVGQGALTVRREEVERFRRGELPAGDDWAGLRVAVAIDGGRTRTRKNKMGKRTRKGRHGFETPWREPKVAVIYVLDDRGRKDRKRPEWIEQTMLGPDALMELVAMRLHRLGAAKAKSVVFLGDGADWIWDRVETVVKRACLDSKRVFSAVDLSHVVSQLAKALETRGIRDTKRRKRELTRLRRKLKAGALSDVIEYLEARARGRGGRTVQGVIRYLRKRARLMHYDVLLRKRLPIGSGAVESIIRRVINMRMKSPGMFWIEENAEGLLALRAAALTNHWDEMLRGVRKLTCRTRRRDWKWPPTPYSAKDPASSHPTAPPKDKHHAA